MKNIFICGFRKNRNEVFLVHNVKQTNRIFKRFEPNSYQTVEQLPEENWTDFIYRAQLTCDKTFSPNVLQRFLDYNEFSTNGYDFYGPFHLQAIPNPDGEHKFQHLDKTGNVVYDSISIVRIEHLNFPNMEITMPFEIESLECIVGQWIQCLNDTGMIYWECKNACLNRSISFGVTLNGGLMKGGNEASSTSGITQRPAKN